MWGSRPATCRAGLFHSVYGTQTFDVSLIGFSQRCKVRHAIGPRAERLVFLFAVCDRDEFFDKIGVRKKYLIDTCRKRRILVTPNTVKALIEIEVANILEQIPNKGRISSRVMRVYERQCELAKRVLPGLAQRHSGEVFRAYEHRYGRAF